MGRPENLEAEGLRVHLQESPDACSRVAPHASQILKPDRLEALPGVRQVLSLSSFFTLARAEAAPGRTSVPVGEALIGGPALVLIAGTDKPRTSPNRFQGLGPIGLALLAALKRSFGLAVVTETTELEVIDDLEALADLIQIGARNMQNVTLLRRSGHSPRPLLLKRGPWATLEEWHYAAENVLARETATRSSAGRASAPGPRMPGTHWTAPSSPPPRPCSPRVLSASWPRPGGAGGWWPRPPSGLCF